MSCELKPKHRFGKVVWTLPRHQIPEILENRGVSLEMWMATFDAAMRPHHFLSDNVRATKNNLRLLHSRFSQFVSREKKRKMQQESCQIYRYEKLWLDLAKQQSKLYRPYGIQVTVAGRMTYEMVGLRFELVQGFIPKAAEASACMELSATVSSDTSEDVEVLGSLAGSEDLVLLDRLYQSDLRSFRDCKLKKPRPHLPNTIEGRTPRRHSI